ncbi:MAG: hypothetical protein Q4C36_05895, partial [Coriobacteriia bacterium]|nr:hypothetical protein [Coriobacteriia bacterium]
MEELNEETLEQVDETETNVPVEETEEEAVELPVDDDVDDDVDNDDEDEDDEDEAEAENEDDEEDEPAEQPDRNRDALRKFVDLHQLLSIFHQRATQPEYRNRGRILGLLNLKDGIETKNMTQILGLHKSDLFTALDKLEAEGLISRVWGDEEQRWATISLTEEGRATKLPSGRITDFAFDGFEDEELDTFIASLERILKNVEAEMGEDAQKLLKEQRAQKPAGKPEDGRGRGGKGGRDDRGGFRKHDDRGGRGGFRKHDDRGGRGGFGGDRDRDRDRGPRREDKGGFSRDNSKRGNFDRDRGPRRDDRGGFGGGRG